ncbi:MAG: hypothetical protein EPO28_12405 [Saprospiraceae bacterium]|nr:MAG: hypothetical protein EPO28_12405 [Saprospiraceae bacterium]
MKQFFFLLLFSGLMQAQSQAQCKIALDTLDQFDTTRLIAAAPVVLGYLVPTGALAEDLDGNIYAEEAKAIFSYADENNIRSFFLTLGVIEHKFHMIDKGYTVMIKYVDGPIQQLLNVPDDPEFDRDLIMWKFMHTCVIPLEVFHMMKNTRVEKIRIVYDGYKSTIVLSEAQQIALQNAVKCVEEALREKLPVRP